MSGIEPVIRRPRDGSLLHGMLTGILGLGYAFIVWNAVFYLVEMAQLGITGYAWIVLLLPAIVPLIVFAVVFALTRRRTTIAFVITMLAGLGLSAVFWLDTLGYAIRNSAELLG